MSNGTPPTASNIGNKTPLDEDIMSDEKHKHEVPPMQEQGNVIVHPKNALLTFPTEAAFKAAVRKMNEISELHKKENPEPCGIEVDCPLCWSIRVGAESDMFKGMVMQALSQAFGPIAAIALNPKGAFMMGWLFLETGRLIERADRAQAESLDLEKLMALPDERPQSNTEVKKEGEAQG